MEHLLSQLKIDNIQLLPLDGNNIRFVNPITGYVDEQLRGFGYRNSISNAASGDDI